MRGDRLRDWYRIARPQGWLFPGQNPVAPMTTRQLTRACHAAVHMAEITKRVNWFAIACGHGRWRGHGKSTMRGVDHDGTGKGA